MQYNISDCFKRRYKANKNLIIGTASFIAIIFATNHYFQPKEDQAASIVDQMQEWLDCGDVVNAPPSYNATSIIQRQDDVLNFSLSLDDLSSRTILDAIDAFSKHLTLKGNHPLTEEEKIAAASLGKAINHYCFESKDSTEYKMFLEKLNKIYLNGNILGIDKDKLQKYKYDIEKMGKSKKSLSQALKKSKQKRAIKYIRVEEWQKSLV